MDRVVAYPLVHPLDNACWHALAGLQCGFAQGNELARRFDPEVAVFSAMPDEPTPESWEALRQLVGPGELAVLFRDAVVAPRGWRELARIPTLQMLAPAAGDTPGPAAELLGPADAAAMLRLAERARPGPFSLRTCELGTYVGVRDSGVLIAMAGERLRLAGYTEISAVSTDAEYRGRGLASRLVQDLIVRIASRGERPFLHVAEDNRTAIRLYEKLGFTTRRTVQAVGLLTPS